MGDPECAHGRFELLRGAAVPQDRAFEPVGVEVQRSGEVVVLILLGKAEVDLEEVGCGSCSTEVGRRPPRLEASCSVDSRRDMPTLLRPKGPAQPARFGTAAIRSLARLSADNHHPTSRRGRRSGLLPEDMLGAITDLQAHGASVAMIGDGMNNASAFAAARVGVATGAAGSDVTLHCRRRSADVRPPRPPLPRHRPPAHSVS
jgi:hypothetical protein